MMSDPRPNLKIRYGSGKLPNGAASATLQLKNIKILKTAVNNNHKKLLTSKAKKVAMFQLAYLL